MTSLAVPEEFEDTPYGGTTPDGEIIIPGLPFARCSRCCGVITLGEDGLAEPHIVACGRECELSPHSMSADTCHGWCERCRTLLTNCKGDPDAPCGTPGCGECGVHIDASAAIGHDRPDLRAACGNERSISRFAWDWSQVTCEGCFARRAFEKARADACRDAKEIADGTWDGVARDIWTEAVKRHGLRDADRARYELEYRREQARIITAKKAEMQSLESAR